MKKIMKKIQHNKVNKQNKRRNAIKTTIDQYIKGVILLMIGTGISLVFFRLSQRLKVQQLKEVVIKFLGLGLTLKFQEEPKT